MTDICHNNGRCNLDEKGTRLGSVLMLHIRHVVGGKMSHRSKSAVLCTLTSSGEGRVGTGGIVVAELQRSRRGWKKGRCSNDAAVVKEYRTDRRNIAIITEERIIQNVFETRI